MEGFCRKGPVRRVGRGAQRRSLLNVVAVAVACGRWFVEAVPMDFSYPGEQTDVIDADVVHGVVYLHNMAINKQFIGAVGVVMKATLSKVCATNVQILGSLVQDIRDLENYPYSLKMEFFMLPYTAAGACSGKFYFLHEDPEGFKKLFLWQMSSNTVTMNMDAEDWEIEFQPTQVNSYEVLYPRGVPAPIGGGTAPAGTTTRDPRAAPNTEDGTVLPDEPLECPDGGCQGPDYGESWRNTRRRRSYQSLLPICQAQDDACLCAAVASGTDIYGCRWEPGVSGGGSCNISDAPNVTCSECSLQAGCPLTRSQRCALEPQPCSCVASTAGCRWNDATSICLPKLSGESTPCRFCSRQDGCSPPSITDVEPDILSSDVVSRQNKFVEVSFDRPVQLTTGGGVQFYCRNRDAPFTIAHSLLETVDNVLKIDASYAPNPALDECTLAIGEGTVVDTSGVMYLGMMAGVHGFLLSDTLAPYIVRFDPPDDGVNVPTNAAVKLTFQEGVLVSTVFRAELVALGQGEASGADTSVANFSAASPEVAAAGTVLTISLDGYLRNGVSYALNMGMGSLVDRYGNGFSGLSAAGFKFTTEYPVEQVVKDNDLASTILIIVAVFVVSLALISTCVCLCVVGKLYRHQIFNAGTQLTKVDAATADFLTNQGVDDKLSGSRDLVTMMEEARAAQEASPAAPSNAVVAYHGNKPISKTPTQVNLAVPGRHGDESVRSGSKLSNGSQRASPRGSPRLSPAPNPHHGNAATAQSAHGTLHHTPAHSPRSAASGAGGPGGNNAGLWKPASGRLDGNVSHKVAASNVSSLAQLAQVQAQAGHNQNWRPGHQHGAHGSHAPLPGTVGASLRS